MSWVQAQPQFRLDNRSSMVSQTVCHLAQSVASLGGFVSTFVFCLDLTPAQVREMPANQVCPALIISFIELNSQ